MALTYLSGVEGFFLKTSAPTDRWDDTEYTEFLYITQVQQQLNNQNLDITNYNSPGTQRKFAESLVGTMNLSITLAGFYDLAEEAGQEVAFQAAFNTTAMSSTNLWWLNTSTLSGLKETAGELRIVTFSITKPVGQVPTFSITCQVTGQWYEQGAA